jgi:hypothetical protein
MNVVIAIRGSVFLYEIDWAEQKYFSLLERVIAFESVLAAFVLLSALSEDFDFEKKEDTLFQLAPTMIPVTKMDTANGSATLLLEFIGIWLFVFCSPGVCRESS